MARLQESSTQVKVVPAGGQHCVRLGHHHCDCGIVLCLIWYFPNQSEQVHVLDHPEQWVGIRIFFAMLPGFPHNWAPGLCSNGEALPGSSYQICCLLVQPCIEKVLCLNCCCERSHIIWTEGISAAICSTLPERFKEHIERIRRRAGTALCSVLEELFVLNILVLVSKQVTSVSFVQREMVEPLVILALRMSKAGSMAVCLGVF